ncbi:hypothetical protein GCM10025781_06140 [Kocuria gwangalliensis]|uniref:Uncharacterized protein n=1 Tax=Kocuria gwangalliensis TaxID=501592 RepID=A0ABP8WMY0_9MICC
MWMAINPTSANPLAASIPTNRRVGRISASSSLPESVLSARDIALMTPPDRAGPSRASEVCGPSGVASMAPGHPEPI